MIDIEEQSFSTSIVHTNKYSPVLRSPQPSHMVSDTTFPPTGNHDSRGSEPRRGLGTSVALVAQHGPVTLGKEISTLDVTIAPMAVGPTQE